MICAKCQSEGRKSRSYDGECTVIGASSDIYYDEEGAYHDHDTRVQTVEHHCSNGHRWWVTTPWCCNATGCTFGGKEETRWEGEPPAALPPPEQPPVSALPWPLPRARQTAE